MKRQWNLSFGVRVNKLTSRLDRNFWNFSSNIWLPSRVRVFLRTNTFKKENYIILAFLSLSLSLPLFLSQPLLFYLLSYHHLLIFPRFSSCIFHDYSYHFSILCAAAAAVASWSQSWMSVRFCILCWSLHFLFFSRFFKAKTNKIHLSQWRTKLRDRSIEITIDL